MGKMDKWWSGLSEDERAAAKGSADAGELDAQTRRSLEDAGVLKQGTGDGEEEAVSFLKMRHD